MTHPPKDAISEVLLLGANDTTSEELRRWRLRWWSWLKSFSKNLTLPPFTLLNPTSAHSISSISSESSPPEGAVGEGANDPKSREYLYNTFSSNPLLINADRIEVDELAGSIIIIIIRHITASSKGHDLIEIDGAASHLVRPASPLIIMFSWGKIMMDWLGRFLGVILMNHSPSIFSFSIPYRDDF